MLESLANPTASKDMTILAIEALSKLLFDDAVFLSDPGLDQVWQLTSDVSETCTMHARSNTSEDSSSVDLSPLNQVLSKQSPSVHVSLYKDEYTTLMLKNIPNKYTRGMLVNQLTNRMPVGSFDFVYMPIDFVSRCNFGYAFVNLRGSHYINLFYKKFVNIKLPEIKTSKLIEIVFARVQGFHSNVNRLVHSVVLSNADDESLPIIFSPSGKQIPFRQLMLSSR